MSRGINAVIYLIFNVRRTDFVILRVMNDVSSSLVTLLSNECPTSSLLLPHRQRGPLCKFPFI